MNWRGKKKAPRAGGGSLNRGASGGTQNLETYLLARLSLAAYAGEGAKRPASRAAAATRASILARANWPSPRRTSNVASRLPSAANNAMTFDCIRQAKQAACQAQPTRKISELRRRGVRFG